jgi:hypothetical protein
MENQEKLDDKTGNGIKHWCDQCKEYFRVPHKHSRTKRVRING